MGRLAEWLLCVHTFFTYTTRHYYLGLISGKSKTCGKKINYKSKATATKAASKMSIKYGEPKEAYPCVWCRGWHIGRKM